MRMIGNIPRDADAERFSDYLLTQKIDNMVEESANGNGGGWLVWVEHDDDVERGKAELEAFLRNAGDAKYDVGPAAERIRKEEQRQAKRRRAKYVDVRTSWSRSRRWAVPVTLALIIISCLVSVGTGSVMGGRRSAQATPMQLQAIDLLRFTPANPQALSWFDRQPEDADENVLLAQYWLSHMARGQVWRVITPIFVHWSILHLIFNMFWLRDLGAMIESQRGTWRLLGLVLLCAVLPNFAEYFWSGPMFGGMSGVVYGLFGYVWMKMKFEPHLGLGIRNETVWIMMGWLVLGMLGVIGNIANAAHLGGLIVGVAAGYMPYAWKRWRRATK